jgi:hypothetical protein
VVICENMLKLIKTSIHITLLSLFALGIAGRVAAEGVHFDFEQKFFEEYGYEVKDHCLIRNGSTYHLFYLRGNPAVDIGHATSPDLKHWTTLPPLLYTGPDPWDGRALWAPQVIRQPSQLGVYFLFYTGVNFNAAQQTGLAYSTWGLNSWAKVPQPIYHPDPSWAMWSDTLVFAVGRDPYVFENEGTYYMLNTAKTIANKGAIACATSPDMYNWTDVGPLYVHNNWHVLESNFLVQRNGKFHLFFTEEVVNGTSHMAADSLFGGWDIGTRTIIDAGHAPEVNTFDEGKYIFSRHTTYYDSTVTYHWVIRFDSLLWAGDTPYVYKPWPLADNWTIVWGNAFIYQPELVREVSGPPQRRRHAGWVLRRRRERPHAVEAVYDHVQLHKPAGRRRQLPRQVLRRLEGRQYRCALVQGNRKEQRSHGPALLGRASDERKAGLHRDYGQLGGSVRAHQL